MRLSRIGLALGIAALVANGAFAQKVTTDYAKEANLGQYKAFMWIMEPTTTNPLMRQRIIDEVNSTLTAKGLKLVTADADLAIAAHTATREERTLDTFYNGFGGGSRWGGGFGSATTTVNRYDVGTFVVDLFDARTKKAIWRGSATKMISGSPQQNAGSLNKAIAKMFERYPPQSRTQTRALSQN